MIYDQKETPPHLVTKLPYDVVADDCESWRSSDDELNEDRQDNRDRDGFLEANIQDRCVLINGRPDSRLGRSSASGQALK